MGHKYDIDAMYHDTVAFFRRCFPNNLEAAFSASLLRDIFWVNSGDLLKLLNYAEETGTKTILPLLYYDQLRRRTEEVLSGCRVDDGEAVLLSPTNQRRLLVGKDCLQRLERSVIFAWASPKSQEDCRTVRRCEAANVRRLSQLLGKPNLYLKEWDSSWGEGLCTACTQKAKKTQKKNMQDLWASLPEIFGLPPWNQLTDGMA